MFEKPSVTHQKNNEAPQLPKVPYNVNDLPEGLETQITELTGDMFNFPNYKEEYDEKIQAILDKIKDNSDLRNQVKKYLDACYNYGKEHVNYLK